MNGLSLKEARLKKKWTQQQSAHALAVTQAYLSMLENGHRSVSAKFLRKAQRVLNLPPTSLALRSQPESASGSPQSRDFGAELGALGYPGFAYLRTRAKRNPAQVLLDALNEPDLDARVAEGLPWLALAYVDMDWAWLTRNARLLDRQNRLGFALSLALEVAERKSDSVVLREIQRNLVLLEPARLAREDTFCRDSMTRAEKEWLRYRRSPAAVHWNLLTDMKGEHLASAFA